MVAVDYPDPRAVIVEDNGASGICSLLTIRRRAPNMLVSFAIAVTYPTPSAWAVDTNPDYYTGFSYHLTYIRDATVEFTFTGTEVWFYADKNLDHGFFSAVIDDGEPIVVNGFGELTSHIILFTAKVSPGRHTLTLKNLEAKALGIDYFA